MILIHILIFIRILILSIKIHGNRFSNTVVISIILAIIMYLLPLIFYYIDNSYVNPWVKNGYLNSNLLFYIELYYLLFVLFTAKFIKIPSYHFEIPTSSLFPIIYIFLSLLAIKLGFFIADVTENNINTFFSVYKFVMNLFFFLGLYYLTINKSKYLKWYLFYYVIYIALYGPKGGIIFVLFFSIIFFLKDKKIFSLKNIKLYLFVGIFIPLLLFLVMAYRALFGLSGNGKGNFDNKDIEGIHLFVKENFNIFDTYYYIVRRADQISLFQMVNNNFKDDNLLKGKTFELIPINLIPRIIFPSKVNPQEYLNARLTEKIKDMPTGMAGNTNLSIAVPLEAYLNFGFIGFILGALHRLIYNIFYQFLANRRNGYFFIAYVNLSFFIIFDMPLRFYIYTILKITIYFIIIFGFYEFIKKLYAKSKLKRNQYEIK